MNALCFLYKEILDRPHSGNLTFVKSQRPRKLPVVLTEDKVGRLFDAINADYFLPAALMYGSGLRLMETVRLRVKDVDETAVQKAMRCEARFPGLGRRHKSE